MNKELLAFLKRWTLPVSMATGALVYLLFAFVPWLDDASESIEPVVNAVYPAFMFGVLFVTFCKVDFRAMRLCNWHLWLTLVQMLLTAALVACILCLRLEGRELVLAEGLLACVVAPTASAAAVVTAKLGGDLDSMTAYTFFSNFIAALVVPLVFPLVAQENGISFGVALWQVFYKVCLLLVLPMAVAYFVKHFLPHLHSRIVSVRDLSFYLWGGSLTMVTGVTMKHIVHANTSVLFLLFLAAGALLICLAQFGAGRLVGRLYHTAIDAGQSLGQKNTVFAIWAAATYLNPLSSVCPGCYILWQNIINSVELLHAERRGGRVSPCRHSC